MEEKTFEKFVEYAAKYGYRVYKTSPETAIVVGHFEIEEPIEEPADDPSAYEQIFTNIYQLIDDKVKCVTCGEDFYLTKEMTECPNCFRRIDKIINDPYVKYKERE